MKQLIRIIGGNYRGKKIDFPEVSGLRPTPDRVRETLFNWLMHDIRQARCLDAFAGSGALGLEAFSRGAAEVSFIEQNPRAYASLKQTILGFESEALSIINTDACEFIRNTTKVFDIVFLDPPFKSMLLSKSLQQLSQSSALAPDGLVYIESADEILPDPSQWRVVKHKKAGLVFYGLYSRV